MLSCLSKTFFIRVFATIVIIPILIILSIILWIHVSSLPYKYSDKNSIPAKKVAIVFGARVYSNHALSPMLKDRVDGAIELYKLQRIQRILMTGDNGKINYDEVTAMKDYALKQGTSPKDIVLDYAGFSTYDSCYRARNIFGLHEAILVTQNYHLTRALYTCRKLGINAVGFGLQDFELYPDLRIPYTIREYGAKIKAWWQLNITHPRSELPGTPIPIK